MHQMDILACWLQEMFLQGDLERALGLPISPLMDRNKAGGVQVVATTMLNAAVAAIMGGVRRVCK